MTKISSNERTMGTAENRRVYVLSKLVWCYFETLWFFLTKP